MALVRRIALFLSVAVIALALALPNTALAWLRSEYRWLARPLNWLDDHSGSIDLVHVAVFAVLGVIVRLTLPDAPVGKLMLAIVTIAGVSEVMQFWVPGRTPRTSDFVVDMFGAMLGVALATSLLWISSRVRNRG